MEASQMMIHTESRVEYMETSTNNNNIEVKKSRKKSTKNRDENNTSVSKSSEKLYKKMQSNGVESNPECYKCQRAVYAMERVKAEKKIWHKECFRCCECNRNLTVETYQSHEGFLYCKQHFRSLFAPRVVEDEEQTRECRKVHA